jgi:thiol-disulfide isomerase/thioredoxin
MKKVGKDVPFAVKTDKEDGKMRGLRLVTASALVLVLAGSAARPAPENAGGEVMPVKPVKYGELGQIVRDQRGKVVVVDFWGVFCVPCMREFPHLVELNKKYADKGLACISVSLDPVNDKEKVEKANAFLRKMQATFTNLILNEPFEVWQKKMDLDGPPCVCVFDRAGRRVAKFPTRVAGSDTVEPVSYEAIEKLVQELLKQ